MINNQTNSEGSVIRMMRSERGSVVLHVLMVLSVLLSVSLSAGTGVFQAIDNKQAMKARKGLSSLRSNVLSDVFGGVAWDPIISDIRIKMKTFRDEGENSAPCPGVPSQTCIVASGQPVVWHKAGVEASGSAIVDYDSKLANMGFTMGGKICTDFSESGNDQCPIRLDLTWRAVCLANGKCEDPQVSLFAKFRFRGGTIYSRALNGSRYNIEFVR